MVEVARNWRRVGMGVPDELVAVRRIESAYWKTAWSGIFFGGVRWWDRTHMALLLVAARPSRRGWGNRVKLTFPVWLDIFVLQ